MTYKIIFILAGVLFFLGLDPAEAMAWGPGVHLNTANHILANLKLISPAIAEIISAYRESFRYGCLSADIYMGKGKKLHSGHCHNWGTGFRLLENNQDPAIQSYAYGYLSHLAADTIAHNYYVPNTLNIFPSGGKISHVYIELQADRHITGLNAQACSIMGRKNKQADKILRLALKKPKLPFVLKKQLYQKGIAFSTLHGWELSLRLLNRALPVGRLEYLNHMVDLSRIAVTDLLRDPDNANCLDFDPMGFTNLKIAKDLKQKKIAANKFQEYLFHPDPKFSELSISSN